MKAIKSTIFFIPILLINIALTEDLSINNNYRDCSEINNSEECYNMGCEWVSDPSGPNSESDQVGIPALKNIINLHFLIKRSY